MQISLSSLKPWKNSICPWKSVVPFRRRSPNLQQGLCPWTPLGHGPQTHSCPPTLNDFPPPMPAINIMVLWRTRVFSANSISFRPVELRGSLCVNAKFGEDPSNRCLDMAIPLISRWRSSAMLDSKNGNLYSRRGTSRRIW